MDISQLPDTLMDEKNGNSRPIRIEFARRNGYFSMATNHFHSEYEIYYLFSGSRYYFIKDRTYAVQPGDLVLIGSDEVHKTSDKSSPSHERILLYFRPSYFAALDEEDRELLLSAFSQDSPVLRLNLQERLKVEELLLSLLEELMEKPPGYGLHIAHMAAELLLFTARTLQKREAVPAVEEEPSAMQRKITEIVRYINAHYGEPLDLDGLSARFYISKSHLSRVFKETTGFGFAEYVNLTRIKEARRLLQDTELSITEISIATGFNNFSHFGKMFKKTTGLSPRLYRSVNSPPR
ncbi:AraC family transcriptional regulator [Paenibacillus oralis]|uniref:AraC family transcriptional regulator n=1 Tax=Paenibacillus oralis TaxID=2490856 RepID=A0A3P3UDY1_9BACL|nr:AraC family transcriptional regulator [Paenibacillus oralis]RRJ66653.1 AraC family transcriptional regulator [Paenibacillus oralis]